MNSCNYKTTCPVNKNIIINEESTIYVIGDLHADYEKTVNLFKHFRLINHNYKWIGGDSIVVQLGDQIDGYGRGNYKDASGEIKILDFFDEMNHQAKISGGGVYSLIGNHELMNIMGNFSYVSKEDIKQSGGSQKRKELFRPGGCMATRLSCTRNTILKINDIIFVHAGIIPEIVREHKENTIEVVNFLMKNFFNGSLSLDNQKIKKYLIDSDGVLWNRSLGKNNIDCSVVNKTLESLGANHIVIGHTPQNVVNSKCDDKIWRVDVGLSKSLGNNHFQILEIKRQDGQNVFSVLT